MNSGTSGSTSTRISPQRQSDQQHRGEHGRGHDTGRDERGQRPGQVAVQRLQARPGRRDQPAAVLPLRPRRPEPAHRGERSGAQLGPHPQRAAGGEPLLRRGHQRPAGADGEQREQRAGQPAGRVPVHDAGQGGGQRDRLADGQRRGDGLQQPVPDEQPAGRRDGAQQPRVDGAAHEGDGAVLPVSEDGASVVGPVPMPPAGPVPSVSAADRFALATIVATPPP